MEQYVLVIMQVQLKQLILHVYWIIPTIILVISTAFFMRDTMVARMYTEDMREICELQEIELLIIWIVINGIYFWIMNRKVGKELKADDK